MNKTVNKIKTLANKAAEDRLTNERQVVEDRVNADLQIIEKILEMVKDRLVYKEVKNLGTKYVVVTEEMVLADYTTKPEGYSSGTTEIKEQEGSYYSVRHIQIRVNGHIYYHAQDIFTKYEWEIKQLVENSEKERDIIQAKRRALQNMKELEPFVKEIMLNHQKHGLTTLKAK